MKEIPCRECLLKAICKHRLDQVILTVGLECCILDEWIERNGAGRIDISRLNMAYDELSLTEVRSWGKDKNDK